MQRTPVARIVGGVATGAAASVVGGLAYLALAPIIRGPWRIYLSIGTSVVLGAQVGFAVGEVLADATPF